MRGPIELMARTAAALAFALVVGLSAATPGVAQSRPCGLSPGDWCPASPGDACSKHRTAAACRADSACYGIHYNGESVVACKYDARGFPTNCPVVGCTSHPPAK